MTYETLPHTPQFTVSETPITYSKSMTFQTGDSQVYPLYHLPRRSWALQWRVGSEEEQEDLKAFLKAHNGAETPFYWVRDPHNPVPRPYMAPTVEFKGGGSTSLRSLYVGYTWSDGTNETMMSYNTQYVVNIPATYTMIVTTEPFPKNVTEAEVYVGNTEAGMKRQLYPITDPEAGWTEPSTGWTSGGPERDPPTTNELVETILVYAVEDTLETRKLTMRAWSLSVQVMERFDP
jgi:hypothetical protein